MSKQHELKNTEGSDKHFTGQLLAEVSSATDSQKITQRMYWTEHKLFLTDGGTYILQTIGANKWRKDERSRVTVIETQNPAQVCKEVTDLITKPIEGRGGWMAALLLDRAGLLKPVTID